MEVSQIVVGPNDVLILALPGGPTASTQAAMDDIKARLPERLRGRVVIVAGINPIVVKGVA